MNLMKLLEKYEAKSGEPADEVLREVMEYLDETGKKFTSEGRKDAAQSLPAAPPEKFARFGFRTINNPEIAVKIANIMQACYMEGYRAASKSDSKIPS